MTRDHRKLEVFLLADQLVLELYAETDGFPADERYGIRKQLRRAAVSVPCNIVEGCARSRTAEYRQFINIATGSAAETLYLLDMSQRLGFLAPQPHARLHGRYTTLVKQLKTLFSGLESLSD